MSYKDGYKSELGAAPAGSLQPLTSTLDGTKWNHGVNADGIAQLGRISSEINEAFDQGVRNHVKMQIQIGRLLNEARLHIPGDQQFGQWRAANTPINNKSSANKLMNLAKQVGDGRITSDMVAKLPLSNLKELLTAPDTVLGEVAGLLEQGEQPTRDEIRDMVRAENTPESPDGGSPEGGSMLDDLRATDEPDATENGPEAPPKPAPAPAAPAQAKGPAAPAAPPRITPASMVPKILAMSLTERLGFLDPDRLPYDGCKVEEWAWLVFGLDPVPAYLPGELVVSVLYEHYSTAIPNSAHNYDRLMYSLQKADKILKELIESDKAM